MSVRSVAAILALSVGAGCALAWTASRPNQHPLVFALGLSWIIACAGGATSPVFHRLAPLWFRPAPWECNGRVYEWIGIRTFRWLLLHTPLGWLGPLVLSSGRLGLDRLLRDMNAVEGGHAVAAGLSLVVAAAYALTRHTTIATWLVLSTIPLNVYPVVLQRWNRGRVLRLQQRLSAIKNRRC